MTDAPYVRLAVVPLTLREANRVVEAWHRHHQPARGQRFALGAVGPDGALHGAAIVSRPVARPVEDRRVAEVVRLTTDGTRNVPSLLYGACARACRAMGFEAIQTYTLVEEPGTSLEAAGWTREALVDGRQWVHSSGPRRTDQPTGDKVRWVRRLNAPRPEVVALAPAGAEGLGLFDPLDRAEPDTP